jgi:hypothetical protein
MNQLLRITVVVGLLTAIYPRKENGRTFPAPLCEAFAGGSVEWLSWRFLPAEEEFGLFWQARQPLSSQPTTE